MAVFVMKPHPSPTLSVIIPSRDGRCGGNVERLLASIRGQERIDEAEILLVVGESPNGHARNVGVDASRGRWLVFMDDDAVLHGTRILAELVAPFETPAPGEPIGMTGTATCLPDDAAPFQHRIAQALPRVVFPPVEQVTETDMAHHLCCALPRSVYEEIGRESDTLEAGTDVDLRHRLRHHGYRIVVVPRTLAAHPQPSSLRAYCRKHFWYGTGKVELDRLYPPSPRNRIRGGRLAALTYLVRALATFPLRLVRFDRASSWQWNPLRAVADLAQKLGYVRAYWLSLDGLSPTAGGSLLSSGTLERWLEPAVSEPVPPLAVAGIHRILVVATAGLGDALTMLPLLEELRRHSPRARITAWVERSAAADVLTRRQAVDDIIQRTLSARGIVGRVWRKLALIMRLRWRRFDLALVNFVNSNAETAVILRLGGVPLRAGYVDEPGKPGLFNLPVHRPSIASRRSALERHLDLLPALGLLRPAQPRPSWPVPDAAREAARVLVNGRAAAGHPPARRIGFHPGCGADMHWKRWPAERFAALADRLAGDGAEILFFGGPEERSLVAEVRRQMRHASVDLAGATPDLDITAALIEMCDLFVSNDSGLYHLALCVPVPVVVLFGPSLHQMARPWETRRPALLLHQAVPCHPCYDYRQHPRELPCPVGIACRDISVDRAHAACCAALAGHRVEPESCTDAGEPPRVMMAGSVASPIDPGQRPS